MLGKSLVPEISELIAKRDFSALRDVFSDWYPGELAELLGDIPQDDQAIVFRILPAPLAADTFEYLDLDSQKHLLKALGREEVSGILNEMAPDDRTALLEELPGGAVRQLVELLSPDERKIATNLLGYPEDSVGRLMTPDYVAVRTDMTVGDVFEHIRNFGRETESLNMIYVVDDRGKLIDDIRMHEFLFSTMDKRVSDLMDSNYVHLTVTEDKSQAVEVFRKHARFSLPVVNSEGILLGIVTLDDVLEDIHKFGGLEALEYPYSATPLLDMVKKRAGWLIVLFIGEMLTATAMGYFEDEIAKAVVLALFVPLIISSGGNSGSQAATLIIRAMALGEITLKDWWRVMRRELISGALLGVLLGLIGFIRIAAWSAFSNLYGEHWFLIALTVSFSLVGVVTWGTLSGSMLPLVLRRLGFDPATSSAPFVATMVDVTGLLIYFSVGALLLSGTLL